MNNTHANSLHGFTIIKAAGTLAVLGLVSLIASERILGNDTSPNILIIFTDDQGVSDLGCFGSSTNLTPNMDQLAKEGTRFTQFYAQHVCGPSRSALLTGRYPFRSKGWSMPTTEITFAELLKQAGYQTACIGKWDVSNRKPILDRMPNAQGFDFFFGTLGANDNGTVKFHENNQPAGKTRDMGGLTELYTDKAIHFLTQQRDPQKPFLLYLAHTMMHTIIDASPKFKNRSKGGLYGDVVEEFDFHTGRLLDALKELELDKDTIVIYTSDNGPWNQPAYTNNKKGHPEGSVFWGESKGLRAGKGSCYEAGSRAPCLIRWPGKIPANQTSDAILATIDFLPTFAKLCKFPLPKDRIIDGVDQTRLLFGESETGARNTFYYQGNGIRKGKWKYLKAEHQVPGYAKDASRELVEELYNLESDPSESKNLASEHPETVQQLKLLLQAIETSTRKKSVTPGND